MGYIEPFGLVYLFGSATVEEIIRMLGIASMIWLVKNGLKFQDFVTFGLWFGLVELLLKAYSYSDEFSFCTNNCGAAIFHTYIVYSAPMLMHVIITIGYVPLFSNRGSFYLAFTLACAVVSHAVLNSFSIQLAGDEFPITEFPKGVALLILIYVLAISFAWLTHQKSLRLQSGR
ncbi:hypothetical protein [Pararhizobium sp. LjRoot238]|uniref:hypothetical protein n=1 Tax=Pararhizobium sp. LjRoot238 TaxID=3342293 RepID=UPI003ECDFE6F